MQHLFFLHIILETAFYKLLLWLNKKQKGHIVPKIAAMNISESTGSGF